MLPDRVARAILVEMKKGGVNPAFSNGFHALARRVPALWGVTIAIPISHERVSPVLDTATRLLVVTRRRGKETERKEWVLHPMPTEALARSVAELDVDLLLCAAVSEELSRALERHGIRIRPHLCGPVEAILKASCCGQLDRAEFRMPGCWGRHAGRGTDRHRHATRPPTPRGAAGEPVALPR